MLRDDPFIVRSALLYLEAHGGFVTHVPHKEKLLVTNCFGMWWPGTELNRRRQPFQIPVIQ